MGSCLLLTTVKPDQYPAWRRVKAIVACSIKFANISLVQPILYPKILIKSYLCEHVFTKLFIICAKKHT